MSSSKSHWKLGLFVLSSLTLGFGAVVWLGTVQLNREYATYVTFFDESVQGLEVGSPVKFRGVTIGNVARVGIAPDRRHVLVQSDVDRKILRSLGLDGETLRVERDLRLQLASSGLTGLKFLQADFFRLEEHPLPVLPFPVPSNYLPAAPSTLKSLEDAVVQSVGRLPEATAKAIAVMNQVSTLLDEVNAQHLPERLASTIGRVDKAVDEGGELMSLTKKKVGQVPVEQLAGGVMQFTSRGTQLIDSVNASVLRIGRIVERVERKGGAIDDVEEILRDLKGEVHQLEGTMAIAKTAMSRIQSAADAFGTVARDATGLTDDAGRTLQLVGEAAEAMRRLVDTLERDPDMLLKGRAKKQEQP